MEFAELQIRFTPITKMALIDKEYIAKLDEGCYIAHIEGLTNDRLPNFFVKKADGVFEVSEIIHCDGKCRIRKREYDYSGKLLFLDMEGE